MQKVQEMGREEQILDAVEQPEQATHIKVHYARLDALREAAQLGDRESMGMLITELEPLIKRQLRHYFGRLDEDYLQMGRLRAMELIERFNPAYTKVRFLGYMARFMGCFYWDLKKAELRRAQEESLNASEELQREIPYREDGFLRVEIDDLLKRMPQQESYVLRHHIMQGKTLEAVARELSLTRDQVRYLKAKGLARARESL